MFKLIPAFLAGAALLLHTGPLLAHVEECSPPASTPTATEIAVSSVPIQVSSTTSDYFVLYANVDGREYPVQVKRGESGTTTLEENINALPASDYRVEKYAVADPADVDGDCLDDLADPSPLNHSHRIELDPEDGAMMIADHAQFEELANEGVVNFVLVELNSSTPEIYFQNTNTHPRHTLFADYLGINDNHTIWAPATLHYDPNILLNGDAGVYYYKVGREYYSSSIDRVHTLLAANLPLVDHNLAYNRGSVDRLPSDWVHDEDPRIPVVDEGIIFRDVSYSALNAGEGFGRLQALEPDDRPNPRDIVLYETLPNELSRVAGIISTQPQTPLSHVDLRAKQNKIPNAFIRDAMDDAEISSLVGQYVYYRVTENAFELREATKAEVDSHYESLRPRARQNLERDLSVQAITPLSEIGFEDYDAFGVKAANVAELGKLDFPEGTAPDGFAIPFYFYDEFMKANDLYSKVSTMLADPTFQTDYDTQEAELKDLRDAIKDATTPDWIITALEEMHAEFPGSSLRYRSSTNNEDLPGFSGAGLYDSKTQDPDETEEDGIDKSIKGVWASLWNFRAFVEREFYRIDHEKTAMGILVHPNYTDELVNGVAVSFDPLYGKAGHHYVNSQVGEDLVTNPEAYSLPEGLLLKSDGSYVILHYSNRGERMRLLMRDSQVRQLRRHLDTIHDHFDGLYDSEPYAIEIEFKITSEDRLAIKQARPWVFGGVDGDVPPPPPTPTPDPLPTPPPPPNTPATGAPTITGTAQVGETLAADITGISDDDGLDNAAFAYQWLAADDEIDSATASSYTLVAADAGKAITVRVSFTDDGGNDEQLTSAVTGAVVAAVARPPLTASAHDVPSSHDGSAAFTFELRFGEAPRPDFSYTTVRDHAFTVTGGSVTYVRRLEPGKNVRWEITVTPGSSADVSIDLNATTDCEADGAICTEDGGKLSGGLLLAVPGPNTPATGAPTITGAAQVGETLAADTTGISDGDGLDNAAFAYQWLADDAEINGATASTYTLVADDEGKAIKVRVSFTDDAGNDEQLTSAATGAVAAAPPLPNTPATGAPTITGTAQVGETLTADTTGISDDDGLDNATFAYQWLAADTEIDSAADSSYTLVAADAGNAIKVRVSFTDDGGNDEQFTSAATSAVAAVPPPPNTPATGAPTITGTAQVGETLTAGTTGIADDDGLDNAAFAYQWLADDDEIDSATASSYALADEDAGKAIKVRVSFTDDAGNDEQLTSAATSAVAAAVARPPLTASAHDVPSSHDGSAAFTFELRFSEAPRPDFSYTTVRDHAFTVTGGSVTYVRRLEPGKNVRWEITVTPGSSADVAIVLNATTDCEADGAICTEDGGKLSGGLLLAVPGPNTPATGAPTITGAAQVGETLAADTTGISDGDGLDNAAFAYQWLADDAEISGATVSTYTLVAADAGKAIKVRVSFTDDAGNDEQLTSGATSAVAAAVARPPLTASAHDVPSSHDGSAAFTFELRFSEAPKPGFSYRTVWDHAFTVTGGSVTYVRRLEPGKNVRWEITVTPGFSADVSIALNATTDCSAQGAICTEDGGKLSGGLELTVNGPGQ